MKNYIIFVCLTLLIGCKQVTNNTSSINPFSSFALNEVHRVAICFNDVAHNIATPTEEETDSMETDEYGIWKNLKRNA